MNILYVSNLTGKKSAGLTYSVPLQIKYQSKYNSVFWYNINTTSSSILNVSGNECHTLIEYPTKMLKDLPAPFDSPDLVVFQGVYHSGYLKIAKQCRKLKIPYLIVPRSSLTERAQHKKRAKKIFGNILFFNRFIKKASCIHYLTEQECLDSGEKWNKKHFIIPNGVVPKQKFAKVIESNNKLKGVFIGRSDSYQKGIDLLLDACTEIKHDLLENKVEIEIYAPQSKQDKDNIERMIRERRLEKIVKSFGGIFGTHKEEVLINSHFFILTSRFEGHPMGLIEALSYGLPALVTEGTNMGKDIVEFNAGWTSESDKAGIINSFHQLLLSKNQLKTKSENAVVLSHKYDWNNISYKTSEQYSKIIKSV